MVCRILNAVVWIGRSHAVINVGSVICRKGNSVGGCGEGAAEGATEEAAVSRTGACFCICGFVSLSLSYIHVDSRIFWGETEFGFVSQNVPTFTTVRDMCWGWGQWGGGLSLGNKLSLFVVSFIWMKDGSMSRRHKFCVVSVPGSQEEARCS